MGSEMCIRDSNKNGKYAHIGMKQIPGSKEPNNGWVWVSSGLPVNMTVGWAKKEPNNFRNGENAGSLSFFGDGRLNDISYDAKCSSICECSIIT